MKRALFTVALTQVAMMLTCALSVESVFAQHVIAHRANGCGMTPNSLEAIKSAVAAPFDAIELDVRVSSDRVVYLYHDDEIDDQPVNNLDYVTVQQLAGVSKTPTLASALMPGAYEGFYILDLKQVKPEETINIVDVVKSAGLKPRQVVFQSHDQNLLRTIHQTLPAHRYYLLDRLQRRFPYIFAPDPNIVIQKASAEFLEGVSLKGRAFLNRAYINQIKLSGLRVFVWTINKETRATHYVSSGADGLITDQPVAFERLLTNNQRGSEVTCR